MATLSIGGVNLDLPGGEVKISFNSPSSSNGAASAPSSSISASNIVSNPIAFNNSSTSNTNPFNNLSAVDNVFGDIAANFPKADLSGLTEKGKKCFEALKNPNVKAALKAIAIAEHGKEVALSKDGGYNVIFGGETFSSYSDHPRKIISSGGLSSNAAGCYQFLDPTWDGVKTELGLKDFTPQSQDIAAVGLLDNRGVLDKIMNGGFEQALGPLGEEWASIEGNPYGQGTEEGKTANIIKNYQVALNSLKGASPTGSVSYVG